MFFFLSLQRGDGLKAFTRAKTFVGAKAIAFTSLRQCFNVQQRDWSLRSSNAPATHRATCMRMIIQSLRLRSNSRTCWQVVLKGLSQEIRASPGASQVENPPAYKLLPKILSLPLPSIWRVRELLFRERINGRADIISLLFLYIIKSKWILRGRLRERKISSMSNPSQSIM